MESDGPLVAVADASVSIIVSQIFYDELLADINCLMDVFSGHVYELYCELAATHSQHLGLLVKAKGSDSTPIVIDLHPLLHLSHFVDLPYGKVGVVRHRQKTTCLIYCAECLSALCRRCFPHSLYLYEAVRSHIFTDVKAIEGIFTPQSG